MSSPSVHTDGISDSPDVSMDEEALQEVTTNLSQVSLVIDTVKKKADDDRNDYIKKRMVENRSKMAEITTNHHNLSVEKGNLKVSNENRKVNLLLQRMQEAIAKQNGAVISSSPVILLAPEIDVKDTIRPITLPKVEKIPPYTTWTFLGRNQIMTEDQSVVGRRRIYYDQNGGEALICSDSEEDVNDEEEDKKEFVDSEDKIIRSTIEQVGSSDAVYDLLAQRLCRKPCEIKARYEDLVSGKNVTESSKSGDTDFNMSSYLDKDLEAAMDTFDRIFCRRCLIFDCKLHGCSQDLIFPAEKCSTQNNMDEELVSSEPCGPHCYLQVQTTALSSNASGDLVIKGKTSGPSLRKRLKSHKSGNASSNAENDSENSDSYTTPDKNKRARKCVTRQSGIKEGSSSPLKENSPSTRMYRRKHSFVPTSDQLSIGSNETVKKDKFIEKSVSRQVTDFETWRTMEKSLFEKGLEIFGKNSCLIAMNVLFGLKTCVEVFNALQNNENKGDESTNSQDKCSRIESSENKGTALRTRSSFFRRRSRVRRLKFTSVKSVGSYSMRKRISDKSNLHCRQYNPCGCRSICGNDCSCFANGTACEKYCGCPKNCRNRFRGCLCGKGQCRNRQCPCFAANRECDPDVCRNCWINCGDGTVVKKGENYECENMKLLLRQQQRVILGRSDVSGWGAFLKNDVSKDEYLGEYTGELISHHEADKRGKIYDRENSSFLFNLNDQYVLDAYRKGDKLKFANHSPKPNCYAKVMMVAGDHRVGIFAKENIAAGQELFYDYRYEHDKAPAWAKKPGDSSTRNEDNASSSNGRAKKLA